MFWSFNRKWTKTDRNWLILIKIRLKLRSLVWSRCLYPNWTEIDDQNRQAWNPNRRWFDSVPLIASAKIMEAIQKWLSKNGHFNYDVLILFQHYSSKNQTIIERPNTSGITHLQEKISTSYSAIVAVSSFSAISFWALSSFFKSPRMERS